jgi:hypothetical protein
VSPVAQDFFRVATERIATSQLGRFVAVMKGDSKVRSYCGKPGGLLQQPDVFSASERRS